MFSTSDYLGMRSTSDLLFQMWRKFSFCPMDRRDAVEPTTSTTKMKPFTT